MKESHRRQIEALVNNDVEAYLEIFPHRVSDETTCLHYEAWNNSPDNPESLFADLPHINLCLTELKAHPDPNRLKTFLDLDNNDLIPIKVDEDTIFTREQLEEFSRLQLKARTYFYV